MALRAETEGAYDGICVIVYVGSTREDSMTVLEAIYHVLLESEHPLHYRDIATRAVSRGLWNPGGPTPEATVNAQLSADIKRLGESSRFVRVGKGVYALNPRTPVETHSGVTGREPGTQATNRLSFTDAAEQVLQQSTRREPLHYRAITEQAISQGLIETRGKTPDATMHAQIQSEIERQHRRGERPRFVMLGKGMVGLSRWSGTGLAHQISEHNAKVRARLLERVRTMDPYEFESLVSRVLSSIGFDTTVTQASGDGGVDVRGTLVVGEVIRTKMAVQVKRWKQNIQSATVQQIRGSLGAHEQGLIITTSDFSRGARSEAERSDATPIALMSGDQFVALMIEHNIGVHRSSHDIIELGEDESQVTR